MTNSVMIYKVNLHIIEKLFIFYSGWLHSTAVYRDVRSRVSSINCWFWNETDWPPITNFIECEMLHSMGKIVFQFLLEIRIFFTPDIIISQSWIPIICVLIRKQNIAAFRILLKDFKEYSKSVIPCSQVIRSQMNRDNGRALHVLLLSWLIIFD
jgi:hypothetical protein